MSEGLFAGGDFAGIARREDIKITTVDDIT
jgi:hypothetical protein